MNHRARRQNARRELLRALMAALFTGLMAGTLIAAAFAYTVGMSLRQSETWTGNPYIMLYRQLVHLTYESRNFESSAIERLQGSFENKASEFKAVPQVEALGDARLDRVQALFERGVRDHDHAALIAATREADALLDQARQYIELSHDRLAGQIEVLKFILIASGSLAAIAFAVLITRLAHMWRAENTLRTQQTKLSREVSLMASHELRRPLQQLALVADLLQHDHLIGEAERARLFQRLQDSAAQLAVLSDLSRLEAVYAEPELARAPHDLAELLESLARPRVLIQAARGVLWNVDAVRFRQSVENVLENALKYAPGDVRVELHVTPDGPEVHVVDRGPGIPPQDRERVFEPFYRAPGSSEPGHGLGLAIARRFMTAHGGDILLRDEPGGGTRAVLTLAPPQDRRVESRAVRTVRGEQRVTRS